MTNDPVNHPKHYTSHPSGVECITVTEHMGFNLGSAMKYLWRADEKGAPIEDLRKAVWYIQREIGRRSGQPQVESTNGTLTPPSDIFEKHHALMAQSLRRT